MTWVLHYGKNKKRPLTKAEERLFTNAKLKRDGTLDRRTNKALLKLEQALAKKTSK